MQCLQIQLLLCLALYGLSLIRKTGGEGMQPQDCRTSTLTTVPHLLLWGVGWGETKETGDKIIASVIQHLLGGMCLLSCLTMQACMNKSFIVSST